MSNYSNISNVIILHSTIILNNLILDKMGLPSKCVQVIALINLVPEMVCLCNNYEGQSLNYPRLKSTIHLCTFSDNGVFVALHLILVIVVPI